MAAEQIPSLTVSEIKKLPNLDQKEVGSVSNRSLIRLQGVVTSPSGWRHSVFVQDATGGISVDPDDQGNDAPAARLRAGDIVEMTGRVHPGLFAPNFSAASINVRGRGELPPAELPANAALGAGKLDSRWIELTGIVHSARVAEIWGRRVLLIDLRTAERVITVHVLEYGTISFHELIDSVVTVSGVCGTIFNDQRQLIGLRLFVPAASDVRIDSSAPNPFDLPVTRLDKLNTFDAGPSLGHRIRVSGVVTHQLPDGTIFIQDEKASVVRLHATEATGLAIGARVDAVGFLSPNATAPTLEDAVVRISGRPAIISPVRIRAADATRVTDGFGYAPHDGRLIEVEGEVIGRLPQIQSSIWLMREGGTAFQAELSGQRSQGFTLEPGSRVRLTGICVAEFDESRNPKGFRIELRNESDIVVLNTPFWTFSHLAILTALLFLISAGLVFRMVRHRHMESPDNQANSGERAASMDGYGRSARLMGLAVCAFAAVALMAWATDFQFLQRLAAGQQSIDARTLVCFLAAGAALWLNGPGPRRRNGANACVGLVVTLSALTLIEKFCGSHFPFDLLLTPGGGTHAGTKSDAEYLTTLALLFWSGTFWLVVRRRVLKFQQRLTILPITLGLLNFVCYCYGIKKLQGVVSGMGLTPIASVCFLLLGAGILFTRPESRLMRGICANASGGIMARQMLPSALLLPGILGWILWQGQLAGLYDGAFGMALFVAANMISFSFLVWNSAAILYQLDGVSSKARAKLQASETALQHRNRQLDLVFDDGGIGDWTLDFASGQISAHKTVWRLYGETERSGSETTSWFKARQHPDDRGEVEAALCTAIAEKKGVDIEFRIVWPDTSVHWISRRATVICDKNGLPVEAHGLDKDVTARRNAEEARKVAQSERERFKNTLDQTLDAVFMYDARSFRFIYVNEGGKRLVGYTEAEILAMTVLDIETEFTLESFRNMVAPLLNGMKPSLTFETLHQHKDGSRVEVEIYLQLVGEQSAEPRFVTIVRDVTDRKRAEAEIFSHSQQLLNANQRLNEANADLLQAKMEADAANRAKSTFLSHMSHEIRTPMNAILGYTQLMLRDSELGPDTRKNLQTITRSGDHLLTLINSVLDMSKIEAGHTEIHLTTFSVSKLRESLEAMFRLRAEAKALEFEISMEDEMTPYLVADEGKVRQVLINLIGNAIKFTERGRVRLSVAFPNREDRMWLSAVVEDTGPGINEEEQVKLFRPFTQTSGGLNTQQGTGLGLAISRVHARLMGGDLIIDRSTPNGSHFKFEIPVERGNSEAVKEKMIEQRAVAVRGEVKPKILVVDDQMENRDWLMKLLSIVGFLVREAENGESAFRICEDWNPQLVLMDVHMPVMDGFEATQKIKSAPGLEKTIIIVLTADAMEENRRTMSRSGADDFLTKPCGEEDLLKMIGAHLNISYEYENSSQPEHAPGKPVVSPDGSWLHRLPPQLVEELHKATVNGDKELMDKLISKVNEMGDSDSAQVLQRLADNYQYDELTELLEAACCR